MILEKFEPFQIQCKKSFDKTLVWCPIRNKWLVFTPEEWVRQQWIQYFLNLNYPKGWIIAEYSLNYQNKKNIRLDLALLNENQNIFLLAEFKKMDYEIGIQDLEQVIRYASHLNPEYILISNYQKSFVWNQKTRKWNSI